MSVRLTLELPESAFSALRGSPDEFGRELRLAAAVKWYKLARLSQGKAAKLAGLSRAAVAEMLARVTAVETRRWIRRCGYKLTIT